MKKHAPLFILGGILVIVLVLVAVSLSKEPVDFTSSTRTISGCNVGVVSIDGAIDTNRAEGNLDSLTIAQTIRKLGAENKKALLVLIDTPGGTASAAEEIARALDDVNLPTIALVRGKALSGGYWVAASTDYIVAQSTATIGNIGVTSSYLEETELNKQKGYTFREITSGEYKEVGNVNKLLTAQHRQYLQDRTNAIFEIFKNVVKTRRGFTQEEFNRVADGKFYIGQEASTLRLIDEVGGIAEAKTYLAKVLKTDSEDLLFCEPAKFE